VTRRREQTTKYPGIYRRHEASCASERCGCSYLARAFVEGRRISKAHGSLAAARSWKASVEAANGDGDRSNRPGTPDEERTALLADAWAEWLDGAERGQIVTRSRERYAPATLSCYDQAMRIYVLPSLGGRRVHAIGFDDLDAIRLAMLDMGVAASTTNNAWNALSVIYRQRHVRIVVGISPVDGIRTETERPAVRRGVVLDAAGAAAIIAAMRGWSWVKPTDGRRRSVDPRPRLAAFWALVLYAGLRRSEATNLDWGNVDLEAGVVRVRPPSSSSPTPARLKTPAATREIPIGRALREALVAARGPDAVNLGSVVGLRLKSVYAWSYEAMAEAGLDRFLPHDGRKTFLSGLAAAGVDQYTLTRTGGHRDVRVADTYYIRSLPGSGDRLREMIDSAF
jgi:integrase